jgi:hypothetical protein
MCISGLLIYFMHLINARTMEHCEVRAQSFMTAVQNFKSYPDMLNRNTKEMLYVTGG